MEFYESDCYLQVTSILATAFGVLSRVAVVNVELKLYNLP